MSIAQAALAEAKHIAHIVTYARDGQATRAEVSADAEEAWIEKVKSLARLPRIPRRPWGCTTCLCARAELRSSR